jgi:hypothetical protein
MCNNISDQLKYYSFLNDWDLIVVGDMFLLFKLYA